MNRTPDVLRIRIQLNAAPLSCDWMLVSGADSSLHPKSDALPRTSLLTELPQHTGRVDVVIAACDVLLVRRQLPANTRRHTAAVLAFAVEEMTAADPENSHVTSLGTDASGRRVLAVIDKIALQRWRTALLDAGIRNFQLHCETLQLPWTPGAWSVAWDGAEGCVRTDVAIGSALDSGTHATPPLSLQLLVTAARADGVMPATIDLYTTTATSKPDLAEWSQRLGVTVRDGGSWHWAALRGDAGPALVQQAQRWQLLSGIGPRLRPALWLAACALGIHALVSVTTWAALAGEQRDLRAQMEARFRQVFPEAVAVVDPALQMRRQLATARQAQGTDDSSDLLPMLEHVALALGEATAGSLQTLSYEQGRLTLELARTDAIDAELLLQRLRHRGLAADLAPATGAGTGPTLVLTIRNL